MPPSTVSAEDRRDRASLLIPMPKMQFFIPYLDLFTDRSTIVVLKSALTTTPCSLSSWLGLIEHFASTFHHTRCYACNDSEDDREEYSV